MAHGNFKDLNRGIFADKVLQDKAFNIAKDPKYDGYQRGFASVVYKVFDKKTSGSSIENKNISVEELGENYTNQLLETLMKEKYTHLLSTIFGMLI